MQCHYITYEFGVGQSV